MANGYASFCFSPCQYRCFYRGSKLIRDAYSWSIVIGLIIVVAGSVAAWFLSPKGDTQAYDIPVPLVELLADGVRRGEMACRHGQ